MYTLGVVIHAAQNTTVRYEEKGVDVISPAVNPAIALLVSSAKFLFERYSSQTVLEICYNLKFKPLILNIYTV